MQARKRTPRQSARQWSGSRGMVGSFRISARAGPTLIASEVSGLQLRGQCGRRLTHAGTAIDSARSIAMIVAARRGVVRLIAPRRTLVLADLVAYPRTVLLDKMTEMALILSSCQAWGQQRVHLLEQRLDQRFGVVGLGQVVVGDEQAVIGRGLPARGSGQRQRLEARRHGIGVGVEVWALGRAVEWREAEVHHRGRVAAVVAREPERGEVEVLGPDHDR